MILSSTSDLLKITTSATADIHVQASWADKTSASLTAGRTNTTFTSATTKTVVGSPGASTQRSVHSLHIANVHATDPNTLTIVHYDGSTNVTVLVVTLAAGETLEFDGRKFVKYGASTGGSGGSGDVVGPASATDNAAARFDTTTGKLLQNSGLTIPDGVSGSVSPSGGKTLSWSVSVTLAGIDGKTLTINDNATITTFGATLTGAANAAAAIAALGLGTLATQSGTFSGTHSGSSSGTNTGDQTITLTGDVTGSGTGSFAATIANSAVTYAKLQSLSAASVLLGRGQGAGAGVAQEITLGSGLSMTGTVLAATGGGGGVTSVGVSAPGEFSVSGSPVTSSGTIGLSWNTQAAGTFLGGPVAGSAATPSFRVLDISDIPEPMLSETCGDASDGNVTITTTNATTGPLSGGSLTRDAHFNTLTIGAGGRIISNRARIFYRKLDASAATVFPFITTITQPGGNASGATGGASSGSFSNAMIGGGGTSQSNAGANGGTGIGSQATTTITAPGAACDVTSAGGSGGAGGKASAGATNGGAIKAPSTPTVATVPQLRAMAGGTWIGGGGLLVVGGQQGTGASSGAGDGTNAGGGGGGGGEGGHCIFLSGYEFVRPTSGSAPAILAKGGNGGNGAAGVAGNAGGGGGGGGAAGGVIFHRYWKKSGPSLANGISVAGGAGGNGGNGSGTGYGGNGGNGGGPGRIYDIDLANKTFTFSPAIGSHSFSQGTAGSIAGAAAPGAAGGAGGTNTVTL